MSALDRLAERMFGGQRLETTAAMASVDTQTYIGVATSDSADGSVSVVLSDDVTQPDNGIWDGDTFLASDELGTSVELPTTTAVKKGDRVLVTASGANVMTAPVVTGVVGRGDEQQTQIDAAAEAAASVEGIAQEALDVAEATGQHFWPDTDGVHVTEVTQDEWNDSTSPNYHSGANVLLNALGQLFRNGLNNLLAVLTSGIAIYDGNGNDSANILAEFTANRIRLGKKSSSGESTYAKVDFFDGDSSLASSVIPDGGEGVEGGRKNILLTDIYKLGELKAYGYHGISNQVTNDGQNTKEQAYSSMQAMTSDNSVYSSVGALVLRNNGGTPSSKITMHADYVDLSDNDTIKSVKMEQAIQALNCRSNSNGWVNSDGYANSNRAIYIGAKVDNSSSSVNGHNVSLYLGPAGLNLYDGTAGRTLWNIGLNNPNFFIWAGTKVLTVSNASTFVLFTKAQLQAIVGTSWTPTGSNCSVFVMNGDYGVSANMMSASINSSSEVRVHMNASRNGVLRVNYLIIRFA